MLSHPSTAGKVLESMCREGAQLESLPEARVTEGVSIGGYLTWRATRFADPEETR